MPESWQFYSSVLNIWGLPGFSEGKGVEIDYFMAGVDGVISGSLCINRRTYCMTSQVSTSKFTAASSSTGL